MPTECTDIAPDELYRYLQQSTAICSNCLRILHTERIDLYSGREQLQAILGSVYLEGQGTTRQDGADKYRNRPPACPHCGVLSVHETVRPLSKSEVKVVAANLSVTLDVLEVPHDWIRLMEIALELKTTPETASRDDDNLASALESAVEYEAIPDPNLGPRATESRA